MSDQQTLAAVAAEVGRLLAPLEDALSHPDNFSSFMRELGWDLDTVPVALNALATPLAAISTAVGGDDEETAELDAQELLPALGSFFRSVADLKNASPGGFPPTVDVADFRSDFPQQIVQYLVADYLENGYPKVGYLLKVLGVIRERRMAVAGLRPAYTRREIAWSDLSKLLDDPFAVFRGAFNWGQSDFDFGRLVGYLAGLLSALELEFELEQPVDSLAAFLAAGSIGTQPYRDVLLSVPIMRADGSATRSEVGIALYRLPETASDRPGLALLPYAHGVIERELDLTEELALALSGGIDVAGGIAILARPDKPVTIETGLLGTGGSATAATSSFSVGLHGRPVAGRDFLLLGSREASGLTVARPALTIGGRVASSGKHDLFGEVELGDARITIKPAQGDSDGFLAVVLPPDGIGVQFDLLVGLSSADGFYFQGGAALELTIPIHATLGPLKFDSAYILLRADQTGEIGLTLAATIALELGPLAASVDRIGLRTRVSFPAGGGNLGPVQLDAPSFKFPDGAGLALNAGPVTGGGFLSHDEALGRYAGILDLRLAEIGLTAIGLITTKLPGGRQGFALFINIGVTFSPPISLPYNFSLVGVGGLCAVNRTTDVEELRSGVRTRTLGSILFPEDPILNASKIITDSERVFPIQEGRFVVGPMVKIGWGADELLIGDIAIVLEVPEPIIIALLGQVSARCPKSKEAKIVLNLDVLGVLDIAKESLSFDATLYDSKILVYELYGDSALRLNWGSKPVFALSCGGFHPKFSPPPSFPKLRRITLQLRSTNALDLTCKMYQAITSNSLQFGANLDLHAEACGVRLDGNLRFDSLFIFSPFEFDVGISGSISAKYEGHNIASLRLSFDLSGPTPWHAKGRATLSILCFDVTARFNTTWGSDNKARLPKVDPLPEFAAQLLIPGNWGSAFPRRRSIAESLRTLTAADATTGNEQPDLLVHPAAGLEFRQRYVPLDVKLEMVANADVKNNFKFDVTMTVLTETSALPVPLVDGGRVEEHFARGQFLSLSKNSRLSKPSYEPFKAGARIIADKARLDGDQQSCTLEYESILISRDEGRRRRIGIRLQWSQMRRSIGIAAMQRSSLRASGIGRFKSGTASRVAFSHEAFAVVDAGTLSASSAMQAAGRPGMTMTEAEELAMSAVATGQIASGSVLVVPEYERAAL